MLRRQHVGICDTDRVTGLETRIPPPLLALLSGVLSWVLSFADRPVGLLNNGQTQLVALAFALIGIGLALDALGGFAKRKTTINPHHPERTTDLVTNGVYRFTRNPMYLGLVFLSLAVPLLLATVIGLLGPLLLIAALTRLQIIPEERHLSELFGPTYTTYQSNVRRWL